MKILFFVLLCLIAGELPAIEKISNPVSEKVDPVQQDSTERLLILPPPKSLLEDSKSPEPLRYNPIISTGLSAAFPGIGQFYCKRYIRGSVFILSEIISALIITYRVNNYQGILTDNINDLAHQIYLINDSLKLFASDSILYEKYNDSLNCTEIEYHLARYTRRQVRYNIYNSIGWMVGFYLWNILDAFGCSNFYFSNEPKNPGVAAGLSAIPFLGLGQLYNGSFAKAGVIWTTHTMLAYMAYNNNRLMNDCIDKRKEVINNSALLNITQEYYVREWNRDYKSAFKKRNTYLWYLILFYFYGIFDAAVDAHLHDYQRKIKLKPVLEANKESVNLNIYVPF